MISCFRKGGGVHFRTVLLLTGLLQLSGCGLTPSNPVTPPEILVTAETGSSSGLVSPYQIPYSGTPSPLVNATIPSGLTLRGGVVADNTLIILAKDSGGAGSFLVGGIPLSSGTQFGQVSGPTGRPVAISQITSQILVVLETTKASPQGCLELFNTTDLIGMKVGTLSPTPPSCMALPAVTGDFLNGFLLPLPDGVGFLVGEILSNGSSYKTNILLFSQTAILAGGPSLTPLSVRTLSTSYTTTDPIIGATLSANTVILLPDPAMAAIDLYSTSKIESGTGGSLSPSFAPTGISTPFPPTMLVVDPSNNFLLAGSSTQVSLFGLNSILNPPGTLGALGSISAGAGESFGALLAYTGSS